MSKVLVTESVLEDIADAIRLKNGQQTTYKPIDMPPAIRTIPNSYSVSDEGKVVADGTLVSQSNTSVSANGTYDTTMNKKVTVAVPASAVDSGTKNITANGNNQDVVGFAKVDVNVPNSYAAGDEGKVVSNGALVAQGSDTVTENDTYDTTLINSLTVNVPSSGTTMYTGTYTPSTTPTANVSFSCAGATNFLIRVADTETINMGTGHAYFYLIYADTSKTSQFGSNNGGTAVANGTDRYTTGARNGTAPGVQFTADGVEVIYYNSTSYRWFQAGLTYNWYAW